MSNQTRPIWLSDTLLELMKTNEESDKDNPPIRPQWATDNVLALVKSHLSGEYNNLPILADALEDADFSSFGPPIFSSLITHLRSMPCVAHFSHEAQPCIKITQLAYYLVYLGVLCHETARHKAELPWSAE